RVWGLEHLDAPTLPTAVDRFVPLDRPPFEPPIRCRVVCDRASKRHVEADIRLFEGSGEPVAEVRGVQMYARMGDSSEAE
ncbi:MAG: polyketide synthase dehydratase domain-containing protein, partial [Bradymonadaceae bacterium]